MKGQDIKRRIQGARETVKITKAMQLIATAKINKLQNKYYSSLALLDEMKETLDNIGYCESPLTHKKEEKNVALIVVSGDKGLCGDYNHIVCNKAIDFIEKVLPKKIYVIGQYGRNYIERKGYKVDNSFVFMMQEPFVEDAKSVANLLVKDFLLGETDKVYIIYTAVSAKDGASNSTCDLRQILPVEMRIKEYTEKQFLVNKKHIDGILKQYIWARIYYALNSASLAVNYKRMIAMQRATNNGEDLCEELQKQFNHLRQESITNELLDAEINKRGRQL